MQSKNLKDTIKSGESNQLEFKQTFSKAVIESLVAFSNTSGGSVLMGINDKGEITGVEIQTESIQKWVNEIKQNTQPAITPILLKKLIA